MVTVTKGSSGLHMCMCTHTHAHKYTMHTLMHVRTHIKYIYNASSHTCAHTEIHIQCILSHMCTHTNIYTMHTHTHMRAHTHTSIQHRKNTSWQSEENPACEGTQDTWLVSRVTATSVEGSGTDSEGEYRPAVSEQCVLQSQLRAFLLAH